MPSACLTTECISGRCNKFELDHEMAFNCFWNSRWTRTVEVTYRSPLNPFMIRWPSLTMARKPSKRAPNDSDFARHDCCRNVCKGCAVMQFRLGIKESENTAVRDTATSTEQRSDLGRLQEWHPLRTRSQCVHDWLSLCASVCVCRPEKCKRQKSTQERQGEEKV